MRSKAKRDKKRHRLLCAGVNRSGMPCSREALDGSTTCRRCKTHCLPGQSPHLPARIDTNHRRELVAATLANRLACNPASSDQDLTYLSKIRLRDDTRMRSVWLALAENPSCPESVQAEIINSADYVILHALVKNPSLVSRLAIIIASQCEQADVAAVVGYPLAMNPATPLEALEKLADFQFGGISLVMALEHGGTLPRPIIERMMHHDRPQVRAGVISVSDLPDHDLLFLMADTDMEVAEQAARKFRERQIAESTEPVCELSAA